MNTGKLEWSALGDIAQCIMGYMIIRYKRFIFNNKYNLCGFDRSSDCKNTIFLFLISTTILKKYIFLIIKFQVSIQKDVMNVKDVFQDILRI